MSLKANCVLYSGTESNSPYILIHYLFTILLQHNLPDHSFRLKNDPAGHKVQQCEHFEHLVSDGLQVRRHFIIYQPSYFL